MKMRNHTSNTALSRERGKTKIGYLVLVLFLATLGYLSYRIIPVYVQQAAFDEDLLSLAGDATRWGWDNSRIMNQVKQLGEQSSFRVDAKDIRIQRVRGQSAVTLEVDYTRSEEFPGGYVHVFSFHSSSGGSYYF